MELLYPRCAGLDVHKKTVVACCIHTLSKGQKRQETRTFGTTTRELLQLLDWLREWGCTHVAMESTGVYWQPVYNVLEGSLEILLVNAQHVKNVPGRKTDVKDAEWLAELLRHGLLRASFVPPRPQRHLRELTRGRNRLVEERAAVVNRLQKVLEGANLKLGNVATDVLGVSGRAILEALAAGQTDAAALAELAKGKLRTKREALQAALEGCTEAHHQFLLTQHLVHLGFLEEQIALFDAEIAARLEALSGVPPAADPPPASGSTASAGGTAEGPVRPALPPREPASYRRAVQLLLPVPGLGERVIQAILAETGTAMGQWGSEGRLSSWAGVCPGNRQSGGKRLSGRITGGNPALRHALVQAAHGAIHSKGSHFGALYHRIAARRGKKRALIAVAHALLVTIYHVLLWQEPYRELGGHYLDERKKQGTIQRMVRRLEAMGCEVDVRQPVPA